MKDFTEQQKEDDMKGICAMLFMLLLALLAFCATAMDSVNIEAEADGEVMVMSTGPPSLGVLETQENQDRIEAVVLMCFIHDAIAAGKDLLTENIYRYNPNNERSGLLRWFNYTNDSGAPLHRWICA